MYVRSKQQLCVGLIVALFTAAVLTGGLQQRAIAQGAGAGAAQSAAGRSALTPKELQELSAMTAKQRAMFEEQFALAQGASDTSAITRFAANNESQIQVLGGNIDRMYPQIRDGRANAMIGKFAGSGRRPFMYEVAEREARLAMRPRVVAANARVVAAADAKRQADAAAKAQRRAAAAAAGAAPIVPSRPYIRDPNIPLTPEEAMKNDGVMDRAEMEEEARGVGRLCTMNASLKKYVQCDCYANAFLEQRIKRGPSVSANRFHDTVVNSTESKSQCVNVAGIREMAGSGCADVARTNSRLPASRAAAFCGCVTDTVTRRYTATPRVTSIYLNDLKIQAHETCKAQFGAN